MPPASEATDVDADAGVNPYYLDRVIETASVRGVEASEDIVTGSGLKLLAKGARVDPAVRERLLQHKLRKPLEECLVVAEAVTPQSLLPIAEAMLDRHPFLRELCTAERSRPVLESLAGLRLTPPLQTLLTMYALQHEERISHAVAAALLALGLARRVLPGDIDQHRTLLVAGLVHDAGELYIDPAILRKGTRLTPAEWRHIVTHPVIGHRVLRHMDGAGKAVAEAVLHHHERLDGFGYPGGLGRQALPMAGQVLASAECLAALMGAGGAPLTRTALASKIMPGEFHPALDHALATVSRGTQASPVEAPPTPLAELAPRMIRIAGTIERFRQQRAWIESRMASGSPALATQLRHSVQRMERIQRAFSSAGLSGGTPEVVLAQFEALGDPVLHREIAAIVREMAWRLRELERDSLLHSGRLTPDDDRLMHEVIGRLTGRDVQDASRSPES